MRKPRPLLPKCLEPSFVANFWLKVDVRGVEECWPWIGEEEFTGRNYGTLNLDGQTVSASRVAYAIHNKKDPLELFVLHSCDNRPCCNPKHLHAGTPQTLADDMGARGRRKSGNQIGAANGHSKLTEAKVLVILARIRKSHGNTAIAKDYGVSHHIINKIRKGRAWKHLQQGDLEV